MKKIIIGIILFVIIVVGIIFINKDITKTKEKGLEKVKVAEVAHSIFYAPQYIAVKKGYFKDNGLDVEIILTPGADKVASAVLSKDVQIGFCGSEQSIYIYNSGKKDYLVNFASLTKRDGSFIVSRKKTDNFTLKDLEGKYIIGGRKGGMPEMTLEYTLKENDVDINNVTIDTSIEFASMASAFISGTGDFVTLFEPSATMLEKEGKGYIVGYLGEYGGKVPYTSYNALKSYIKENPEIIRKFTKSINKGLNYVWKTDNKTLAKELVEFFPDMTINDLEKMIKRYKDNDAWNTNTKLTEKEFDHMEDIVIEAGIIDKKVPFKKLVDTSFSK